MLLFLLFIVHSLGENHVNKPDSFPTLGEECNALVDFYYQDFLVELPSLTIESTPDTVKDVRKSVLRLRDLLDVCVFTYPILSETDDKIADIRKFFDGGYEAIGKFKDLEFVKHTPEEQQKLLLKCLDWVRKWGDRSADSNYPQFMLSPLQDTFSDREYSSFSGFFWKKALKKPKTYYTGNQNLARLAHFMMEFILNAYELVIKVDDVTKLDSHEEFHDFRKTLRSLDYVGTFQAKASLPGSIWVDGFNVVPLLDELDIIYMDFGDLNSDIVSYLHDVEKGDDKDKLKKLKEKLNDTWKALKKKLDETGFEKLIESLQKGLLPFA